MTINLKDGFFFHLIYCEKYFTTDAILSELYYVYKNLLWVGSFCTLEGSGEYEFFTLGERMILD